MNKEQATIKTELEKEEKKESSQIVESLEKIRQEITAGSEKEVDAFKKDSQKEIAGFEGGELIVDNEDKEALQELDQEADLARKDLLAEISDKDKEQTPDSDFPPPLHNENHDETEKTKVCAKCGAEIATSAKFCTECGSEQKHEDIKEDISDEEIDLFKPDILNLEKNPSLILLRKIKKAGEKLNCNFFNTPGYESNVDDIISNLKASGEREKALEVEKIFKEERENSRLERKKSLFNEIDPVLLQMNNDEKSRRLYINKQKNLPPEARIQMFHGLNGGYNKVQAVLDSQSHGIEQHSGPTLSFIPVGQFWKKGDLGFCYTFERRQIEFPGENNPDAVVRIGENGDTGIICNKSQNLPLDQFDGEVMRSIGTYPDFKAENKIKEKMLQFSKIKSALGKKES